MQAQQKIESEELEKPKDFYEWIATVDLPEELKQNLIDVEEGRNLSKVYTDLDEWWRDLMDATDPKSE